VGRASPNLWKILRCHFTCASFCTGRDGSPQPSAAVSERHALPCGPRRSRRDTPYLVVRGGLGETRPTLWRQTCRHLHANRGQRMGLGTENMSGDGREKSFSVPSCASLVVLCPQLRCPHLRSSLISATPLSLIDYSGFDIRCCHPIQNNIQSRHDSAKPDIARN
jgi:hypothetical protein